MDKERATIPFSSPLGERARTPHAPTLPPDPRAWTPRFCRASPEQASSLWSEFIAGGFCIVEHADEGGMRSLLLRRRSRVDRPWHALTPRERRVVALAAAGKARKAIAGEMRMCLSSVALTLRSAASKVHASSRTELVNAYRLASHLAARTP